MKRTFTVHNDTYCYRSPWFGMHRLYLVLENVSAVKSLGRPLPRALCMYSLHSVTASFPPHLHTDALLCIAFKLIAADAESVP